MRVPAEASAPIVPNLGEATELDVAACLATIQDHNWYEDVAALYRAARRAFLFGMEGIDSRTPFAASVKNHRTIESGGAYALRDAYLRVAHHYQRTRHPHGQRIIQFDDTPYAEMLRQHWETFFAAEVRRLADDQAISLAIISAVVYHDEPPGFAAEEFLLTLLDWRYEGLQRIANGDVT